MKYVAILFLTGLAVAGCSTVERRTYYTPVAPRSQVSGPQEPHCGWVNFGGKPDQYETLINGASVALTANQRTHPYLFGPWFLSVIPVFPITWALDALVKDDLNIELSSKKPVLGALRSATFVVASNDHSVAPSKIQTSSHWLRLTFPLDMTEVEQVLLIGSQGEKQILNVPLRKASRWAWVQYTPNC
ncbi:hypothetical protein [Salinisphaera shabanensis]|uniref:hypothetical protein n=1 Tax=Salinisphaera shabanensis TaxID=180542 RepID=UPI003340567D